MDSLSGHFHRLGQSKVQEFGLAIAVDDDVCRFQVAMDDAFLVGGLQGLGNLDHQPERLFNGNRHPLDPIGQRFPFDEFQNQAVDSLVFLKTIDGRNPGMVERRKNLSFAPESSHAVAVSGKLVGQHLDGDFPAKPRVPGPPDLSHPAASDQRQNFVVADPSADHGSIVHIHRCRQHFDGRHFKELPGLFLMFKKGFDFAPQLVVASASGSNESRSPGPVQLASLVVERFDPFELLRLHGLVLKSPGEATPWPGSSRESP